MSKSRKSTLQGRRAFLIGSGSLIAAAAMNSHGVAAVSIRAGSDLASTESEIWRDVVAMNDMGPRLAGTDTQRRFHNFLEQGFEKVGVKVEKLPHTTLELWEPTKIAISSVAGAGVRDIPVASHCRHSAVTGPDGIEAPLFFSGRATGPSFWNRLAKDSWQDPPFSIPAGVAGKIALIEVPSEPCDWDHWYAGHVKMIDPAGFGGLKRQITAPSWGQVALPKQLEANLRKAGALGVIYVAVNLADEDASGQMKTGTKALPSLWVGQTAGAELRRIAERGETIRMTVDAKVRQNAPSETLVATLPGRSDETIILWTHTDGINAIEENGAIAILHLMKHFAQVPSAQRNRTIVAVLSEGHFERGYLPTTQWLDERPDLVANAVATIAIEHLGCQEWAGDPVRNTFKPTGKPEMMFVNCPTPGLEKIMLDAGKDAKIGRYVVLDYTHAALPGSGLDAWLHRDLRIPSISWIAVPPYLMAERADGHIDKLRSDQFYDEMKTLVRIIQGYATAPRQYLKA